MQEKQIQERMSKNQKELKKIENSIKGLTDKVAELRAMKQHREEVKE